jgi:hypothetical protein
MKQAIRENRRGKVRVSGMFLDAAPEVALLRSRMDVYDVLHDCCTQGVWFEGYAPEFDALELGEQAPEYDAIFTCDDDGPALGVMFNRRSPAPPVSSSPWSPEQIKNVQEWFDAALKYDVKKTPPRALLYPMGGSTDLKASGPNEDLGVNGLKASR